MSVTIAKASDNCLEIIIDNIFTYKDLEAIQSAAKQVLQSGGKANCIVLAGGFSGWGKEGNWGDMTFMHENDAMIGKIAIAADKKHQTELLMFLGAGLRQAAVKFFPLDQQDQARAWVLGCAE